MKRKPTRDAADADSPRTGDRGDAARGRPGRAQTGRSEARRSETDRDENEVSGVRVIGGALRGRKLAYTGDLRTRPMKNRTREAIYNLLGNVAGMYAVDLFAGTGALGVEALSRGAAGAAFFERHFPTADLLKKNLAELELAERATVFAGDTFLQWKRRRMEGRTFDTTAPWLVFCSPPYVLFDERRADLVALVDELRTLAPPASVVVVEADASFDFKQLGEPEAWRVREYAPAVVGLYRKPN